MSWRDDVLAKRADYMRQIDKLQDAGKITPEHAARARKLLTEEFLRRAAREPDNSLADPQFDQNVRDYIAGSGMHLDFAADVLQRLKQWQAELHGCPVWKVDPQLDGTVAVWFKGPRDGAHWEGALRFNATLLLDRKFMGDPLAVAGITMQLLDEIKSSVGEQPLIERAKN